MLRAPNPKCDIDLRMTPWSYPSPDPIARGGTAPSPFDLPPHSSNSRQANSSYKFSIQAVGAAYPPTSVALRPCGFSSAKYEGKSSQKQSAKEPVVPWPDAPHYVKDPPRSAMGGDGGRTGVRPPTRHKPSPKGLELPPRPITPPEDDNLLEKTWSFALKIDSEPDEPFRKHEKQHKPTAGKEKIRPKSQKKLMGSLEKSEPFQAWDDRSKPRPTGEKSQRRSDCFDGKVAGLRDIPITITQTGIPIEGSDMVFVKRRLQTTEGGWRGRPGRNDAGGLFE